LCGCVFLRGYVSGEEGAISVRAKKAFGQGNQIKEFYITKEGEIINLFDTKDRVKNILGVPSQKEYSLEGYTIWIYKEKQLKIYFDKGYVRRISHF
jgi:hypothetical protein